MKRRVPLDIEFLLESLTGTPINAHQKINEDPDNVEGENGEEDINYSEGDNVAFFCASEYSLIGPGQTHFDLMRGIRHIRRNNLRNLDILDDEGIVVANEQEMFRDIFDENGRLFKYLRELDINGLDAGNYRNDIDGFLAGRLWVNKRVISFWNSQEDVIDNWDAVENMFFEHGNRIGSLRAFKVDWVERSDSGIPMTPADSISSSGKKKKLDKSVDYTKEPEVDDKGQINFFAKLFRNPILLDKLSDAQLKQIRDKVHVMDPALKAQIMKANHSMIVNKAGEIADKLGMSVAEFNSLWSVDETVNESPDSLVMNKKQRAMFAATGHHRPEDLKKISYYDHDDAIAFLIDVVGKITIYNPPGMGEVRLTHPDMGNMVMGYAAYPNDYDKFPVEGYKGFAFDLAQDVEPAPGPDPGPVAVLQANTIVELMKSLKVLARNLPLDGDVPRKDTKFVQGRIWLNSKAVSFWGAKDSIMEHFGMVNELFVGLKLNKSKMVYEFTDSGHLYTYDELTGKSVELRSKEEMDRLMAIQHLSPTAKKKLAMMQGNLKQKGNVGWDFQAQKHAAMPALQESPDQVEVPVSNHKELEDAGLDPRRMNGSHWKDSDAITFVLDATDKRGLWMAADQVVIGSEQYAHRPNHAAMMRQIAYFRQYPSEFEIKTLGSQPVLVSKPDANRLKVWIVKGGVHGVDFSGTEDFSAYLAMAEWTKKVERKTLPGNLILGRYWRNSGVMSFWQKKSWVLEHFKLVEDLLKEFSVNPEKVAYEFIDIRKVFPYNELFEEGDEKYKRGSEEMNDLIKRQHTDPSAKKKLKDLGYYDTAAGKKELGGFDTVAQKHAAMPALQEILRQINTSK